MSRIQVTLIDSLETSDLTSLSEVGQFSQYNWTHEVQKVPGKILLLFESDWSKHIFYFQYISHGIINLFESSHNFLFF